MLCVTIHASVRESKYLSAGMLMDAANKEFVIAGSLEELKALDLESGCTFDLWADHVPTFPVEVREGEVWVKTTLGHADPARHRCQRLVIDRLAPAR
jgi:hypothetical protein